MAKENGEFFVDVVVDEIKASDLYLKFNQARAKLAADADLSEKVAEFRRFSLNLRLNSVAGKEPTYDERRHAAHLLWQIRLNDDAKEFLDAEKELSNIVDASFKKTVRELGLETSFFV